MHKKKVFMAAIQIIVILLLSVLLETAVGNYRAWKYPRMDTGVQQPEAVLGGGFLSGEYKDEQTGIAYSIEVGGGEGYNKLTEEEQKQILIDRENQKILAEVNGAGYLEEEAFQEDIVEREGAMYRRVGRNFYTIQFKQPVYIAKAVLTLPPMQNGTYCYVVGKLEEETVYEVHDGYVDERISTRIFQPNKRIDMLQFEISNEELIEVNAVNIRLINQFQFNTVRFAFFAVLCTLIVFMISSRKWFTDRPELAFAFMGLLLGTLMIFIIGLNQVGYDEHTHAKQAYNLSFGSTVYTTESAMQMQAGTLPAFYTIEERRLMEAYVQENNDFSWANITNQSRFPTYDVRSYLPIAVFLKIGRLLKLPFAWNMMLGRFGNLLCYIAVLYLAICFAKAGKTLIAVLALLPNNLFAATGFTYDAVVNSFLILAAVLTLNLIYDEEAENRKLTWLQVLLVLGAYVVGSTAKPIYIVMALMLLFLPSKRFESRWQQLGFQAAVLLLTGFMVYTIFFPPVSADSNYELIGNLAYAGDKRNQGTSVLGQLEYITGNILGYTKLLLASMLGDLADYLSGVKKFLNYGYLGELNVGWTWLAVLAAMAAALVCPSGRERHTIGKKYIILNIIMVFGVSAIIWTSMYVSFTPVGAAAIQGVQARYFIPLFVPFFSCLFNSRLKIQIGNGLFTKLLLGSMALMNMYALWTLAVLPRNG